MAAGGSLLDINFWTNLLVDGFFLGALIGTIVGAITWTVTERGTNIVLILSLSFILGLIFGVYMEGGPLLALLAGGTDAILESTERVRTIVFSSIVGVIQWLFAFLAIGSAVSSLRRAIIGALIGTIVGTIVGMVMLLLRGQFALTMSSTLADVLIAILSMLMLTVLALNQSES